MNAEELKTAQTPLKTRYRTEPAAAQLVLSARGLSDIGAQACRVETTAGTVVAGLHPATGGDGSQECSGDMLLQALAACAGVTLGAVATSMGIAVRAGTITAEGDLDFRGTLGVSRDAPVGFSAIRLRFDLDTDAAPELLKKLIEVTERYCVVYQTLRQPPALSTSTA